MCFCEKSLSLHPFSTTACPALRVAEGCSLFQLSQLSSRPTLDKSPVDQRAHAERQTTTHTYGQFTVVGQVHLFRAWELATVELYSERENDLSYDLLC